jgi:hypothetical protein
MTTEEMLLQKYGPVLSTEDLASALKFESAKAFVNAVSAGRVPFNTFRRGRYRLAHAADVAAYIDGLRLASSQHSSA